MGLGAHFSLLMQQAQASALAGYEEEGYEEEGYEEEGYEGVCPRFYLWQVLLDAMTGWCRQKPRMIVPC
jgi:hypothetical protein